MGTTRDFSSLSLLSQPLLFRKVTSTAAKLRFISTASLVQAHSASGRILPLKLATCSPAGSIQGVIKNELSEHFSRVSPTNCHLSNDRAGQLRLEFYHSPRKNTAWVLLFFACPFLLLVQSAITELRGGLFASLKWLC